jgi:hypothetical protein
MTDPCRSFSERHQTLATYGELTGIGLITFLVLFVLALMLPGAA